MRNLLLLILIPLSFGSVAAQVAAPNFTELPAHLEFNCEEIIRAVLMYDETVIEEIFTSLYYVNCVSSNRADTPLSAAINVGRLHLVERLLNAGADPNWRNYNGGSLFYFAFRDDDPELLELLLAAGADPNLRDARRHSDDGALLNYLTIYKKNPLNPQIIELLVSYGADLNGLKIGSSEFDGFSPLSLAVERRDLHVVEILLAAGADPNAKGYIDIPFTPFPYEVYNTLALADDPEIFYALLLAGADAEVVGITPLMVAAFLGDVVTTRLLLDAGVDPNTLDDTKRNSALRYAVLAGHDAIATLLLVAGADPNLPMVRSSHFDYPWIVLLDAAEIGNTDTVALLLAFGADPNHKYVWSGGGSALHKAAYHGNSDIVKLLLAAGADPNLRRSYYETSALHDATRYRKNVETIELLLAAGVDPNLQNEFGDTALILATESGDIEMVEFLLAAGADTELRDDQGRTALDIALEYGYDIVAQMLEAAAAN